jgi:anti-sigma-K factor RskA
MISDEMRELLSAYVDGELRDADAARIEEVSKRDPELRREIEAYRLLNRKLREWDTAENGASPSSAFMTRALARARTIDTALAAGARASLWRPLALAAGLLLSVGVGYGLARSTAPGAPPVPPRAAPVAVTPLAPEPDLAIEGSALVPHEPAKPELVHRMRLSDHMPSRRAIELEDMMRQQETLVSKGPDPAPRTGPPMSMEISAIFDGYVPAGQPSEALVVLSRPPELKPFDSPQPVTGRAKEQSEGRILFDEVSGKGPALIASLGEVWVGTDAGRRARILSSSVWAARDRSTFLSVVWADQISTPRNGEDVEAQDLILGPKARQHALMATPGKDASFLKWLHTEYGAKPLPTLLEEGARDRDRAVNKLVDILGRDPRAIGFAVLDVKGNLLGTELFIDHETMLAFAARLLRGYLLEAGEDGIRVAPPRVADRGLDAVQKLLDGMPGRGLRIERVPLDVIEDKFDKHSPAPAGVARVTLLTSGGHPVGHGIVRDDTPIHLTIFGE